VRERERGNKKISKSEERNQVRERERGNKRDKKEGEICCSGVCACVLQILPNGGAVVNVG
jgi:hypothetical protein